MEKRRKQKLIEASMVGLTLFRLLGAEHMAHKVAKGEGIAGSMALFVAADIADGVIARKAKVDTPLRRFMDAAVDRISVGRVAYSVGQKNKVAKSYIAALAAEESIALAANLIHYSGKGEIVQGGKIHKLGSLSVALFGVVAATNDEAATNITGLTAGFINFALTVDYAMNACEPYGTLKDGVRYIAFDNLRVLQRGDT